LLAACVCVQRRRAEAMERRTTAFHRRERWLCATGGMEVERWEVGTHHATFFSASDALTITTCPLSIWPVSERHAGMSVCCAISMYAMPLDLGVLRS